VPLPLCLIRPAGWNDGQSVFSSFSTNRDVTAYAVMTIAAKVYSGRLKGRRERTSKGQMEQLRATNSCPDAS
jgi:hypothetical protein